MEEQIISSTIQGGGFSVLAYAVLEMRKTIDRNTTMIEKVLLKRGKR